MKGRATIPQPLPNLLPRVIHSKLIHSLTYAPPSLLSSLFFSPPVIGVSIALWLDCMRHCTILLPIMTWRTNGRSFRKGKQGMSLYHPFSKHPPWLSNIGTKKVDWGFIFTRMQPRVEIGSCKNVCTTLHGLKIFSHPTLLCLPFVSLPAPRHLSIWIDLPVLWM